MSKSGATSNVLIQQLLTAEEEAEKIVARARENRVKKLKDAKLSAEQEIALFKEKEEAQFAKEYQQHYGSEGSTNADLEEITKKEIELVKQDFKSNKDTVVQYLVNRAMDVQIHLEDGQKRFVIEDTSGRATGY